MERNSLKLFLWLVNGLMVSLLVLWLIGGNLLAAQLEKPINQGWTDFTHRFPKAELNNSALKLQELTAQQGIGPLLGTKETSKRFPTSEKNRQAFEKIRKELDQYLENQLENSTNQVEVPSESLRRYLDSQPANLAAIRTHILNSEIPRWSLDVSQWNPSYPLPSLLGMVNLQKIFALDMLEKNRLGETKEVLDTLEVAWKLNQSAREYPSIIGSLISIIVDNYIVGVIRKVKGIPTDWQARITRLVKEDYPQSFSTSLEGDFLTTARSFATYPLWKWTNNAQPPPFAKVLDALQRPYRRFSAVDYWRKETLGLHELPKQDFCNFDSETFKQNHQLSAAWWNIFGQDSISSLWNQWTKLWRKLIEWELTQKVLQVKEIAAKQGSWPQQVPGIEASVCGDRKWIYQVSPDGTMSISYSQQPSWWPKQEKGKLILPLSYSAKL
jgi:hypothetical protein